MKTPRPLDIAVTAATLAEGALALRSASELEQIYTYEGCFGFMTELCRMAEMLLRIEDDAYAILQENWDCMWAYEVVSPYGMWFGDRAIKYHGVTPPTSAQIDKVFELITGAIDGMKPNPTQREQLTEMLLKERMRV